MNQALELFDLPLFSHPVSIVTMIAVSLTSALLVHSGRTYPVTTVPREEALKPRTLRRSADRTDIEVAQFICPKLFTVCVCVSCSRRCPEKTASSSLSCRILRGLSVRPDWTWKRPHR